MTNPLKFGFQGRMFPPMERVLEAMPRVEAQGWDFINYADQIEGTHPRGLLPLPTPKHDDSALVSAYSDGWFGSFELVTAASVLTSNIEIHLSVLDAVRRNPAVLAQELLTISHISKGRAVWGFGAGEAKQFEPYGEKRTKPIGRMEESLRIMDALWEANGEPVTRDSEFWPLKNAVLPLPLYDGRKPRRLMVGGGPRIEDLVGEMMDGWLTYAPGGLADDPEALEGTISRIKGRAKAHGRDPDALEFNIMALVCPADTEEEAWKLVRGPACIWGALAFATMDAASAWTKWGFKNPLGDDFNWPTHATQVGTVVPAQVRELAASVPDALSDHAMIWGTPERVADRIKTFLVPGVTHVSFWNFASMNDPEIGAKWSTHASEIITRLGGKPLDLNV